MPHPSATAYDEVSYPSRPLRQTHPDRLATLATLFGMTPAPIEGCRVLELGCGDGGNLIPMAFGLPESTFVGFDLAARPVTRGRATIDALGLKNITLHVSDVREITRDTGPFDYIIAHGLYSWVPPAIQDKILEICGTLLAPQGIAYISYNAYPGCRQDEMVREMLMYRTRHFAQPEQKIHHAVAFARFLAENQPTQDPYALFLRQELVRITEHEEFLLFHDDLAEINIPVYFHQFAEHAGRHGLQFLAEADFFEMQDHIYPTHVTEHLRELAAGDVVAREQYLDFLKCRGFRQTLLCRTNLLLDRRLGPERVPRFRIASPARPVAAKPDLRSSAEEQFRGLKGAAMTCDLPLAKAAIYGLGRIWPMSLPFMDLVRRSCSFLETPAPDDPSAPETRALAQIIFDCYSAGLAELRLEEPRYVLEAGERPLASPLARLQIENGAEIVSNLDHSNVHLGDLLARRLLLLLDGAHDRTSLARELAALVVSGQAPLEIEGKPLTDMDQALPILAAGLDSHLARLGQLALLVG